MAWDLQGKYSYGAGAVGQILYIISGGLSILESKGESIQD